MLAPGVDLRWDGLSGYDEAAAERMPHAWKAGAQTTLLRRQLEAMEDGGLVVISAPANPYRCPPGPYERASLIAYYLKAKKPKSKVLILDAKDAFSKQGLFIAAWRALYPNHLEWVALSKGGKVTSVEPATNTVVTEFDRHKAAVANIVPPQKAGRIAEVAGVADRTGWCPIDPVTFELRARAQHPRHRRCLPSPARCRSRPSRRTPRRKPVPPRSRNCCAAKRPRSRACREHLLQRGRARLRISVAGVYKPANGQLMDIPGAGGVSPANAPASARAQEAVFASGWFKTITSEVFG